MCVDRGNYVQKLKVFYGSAGHNPRTGDTLFSICQWVLREDMVTRTFMYMDELGIDKFSLKEIDILMIELESGNMSGMWRYTGKRDFYERS